MRRRPGNLTLTVAPEVDGAPEMSHPKAAHSFNRHYGQEFEILAQLGSGSTSTVSRAIWKVNSSEVAVKVSRNNDRELVHPAQKEYDILKKLSYPTIPAVHHFQAYMAESRAIMVMDYFDGVELGKAVAAAPNTHLEESVVLAIARQLVETVAHIHEHGVLHRDIKPQNILISKDFQRICLIDFNASHCLRDGEPFTPTGTKVYAAPEVLDGQASSAPSDVWGAGLCIYYAMCGRLPQGRKAFSDMCVLQSQSVREISFTSRLWEPVSESCKTFLRKSLAVDEQCRPSATELVREPWIAEGASS